MGYLCDDDYVTWLENVGKTGVYGFAEVQADGRWAVLAPDEHGRMPWTYAVEHVERARLRRIPIVAEIRDASAAGCPDRSADRARESTPDLTDSSG